MTEAPEFTAVDLADVGETAERTLSLAVSFSFKFLFADNDLYSLFADFIGIERNLVSSIVGIINLYFSY